MPEKEKMSERDLQVRVIQYLREFYGWAPLAPGLGEHQSTPSRRADAWAKGYVSGVPDLLVLAPSREHCGLALEFKSPSYKARASPSQVAFLERLEHVSRFRTLVSSDYEEIIHALSEHLAPEEDDVPMPCFGEMLVDA
ncbi:MAG: hypothetical protein B7Z80_12950 [Rhodospirillales bacterium 20-64-7]|nr:MAG: hypothetical protein B7Z80_12950 [Rhodospirillales bacterium 20-64-7]